MFEGLFDEENIEATSQNRDRDEGIGPPPPPRKRSETGLVGLENQGATCYLNSLIQVLRMTPEFRDALFRLPPEELGCHSQDRSTQKCRRIPLEMQKLFAKLQLANRESVSTEALTCSFGWNNNEHLSQQDVQELLQVLFSAVRESLRGCSGHNLIEDVYSGQQVWKITCSVCHRESATVQSFVDVTLALMEATNLQQSLQLLYCEPEKMEKSNQYRCGPCNRQVDAIRTTKLRHLPPVMIFTLTRFNFDTNKGQRCKENKPFGYPMELNMAPYMEKCQDEEDYWYDLFCVVLHRGSTAHGGHYHTYICDVQSQGHWTEQGKTAEEEETPSPVETLCKVLDQEPQKTMTMDRLCAEFSKLAGASWSKKYKSQWGPITKFLQENNAFHYDEKKQSVTLTELAQGGKLPNGTGKHGQPSTSKVQAAGQAWFDFDDARVTPMATQAVTRQSHGQAWFDFDDARVMPMATQAVTRQSHGQAWFDFDDARVTPMATQAVTRQSRGQGCAYMLAYRRRCQHTPRLEPPYFGVPDHLAAEVFAENARLEEERDAYDRSINQLTVELHPACNFVCQDGMLSAIDPDFHLSLTLDQRQTLAELYSLVAQSCAEMIPEQFTLHHMKRVGGILHLYEELEGPSSPLQALGLRKQALLFVWDGQSVHGVKPHCGAASEPIHVTILSEKDTTSFLPVPKNMSFAAFKATVSQQTAIPAKLLVLHKVVGNDKTALLQASDEMPLSQIPMEDGDQVLAQNCTTQDGVSLQCWLQVENRFPIGGGEGAWTPIHLAIPFSATLAQLKQKILETYSLEQSELQGRIRVMRPSGDLQPPVDESLTITKALISSNSTVVLEPGPSPSSSQVMIFYNYKGEEREAVVQRHHTVEQVLKQIKHEAKLPGDKWYLCKTDWLGEAGSALEDGQATLEDCEIYSGDRVALEMGSPPSKDSVRLEVMLCPTRVTPQSPQSQQLLSYLQCALQDGVATQGQEALYCHSRLPVGQVEVAKTDTLQQLKERILALPVLASLAPPVPHYLRLRKLDQGTLGCIFRDTRQTVSKSKLAKCEQIGVQLVTEEDSSGTAGVLLELVQRVPGTRSYGEPVEVFYQAPKGIFPKELRQQLASTLSIPEDFLLTAKYFATSHEWRLFDSALEKTNSKTGVAIPMNLKQAPFCMQDGDTIGFKDLRLLEPGDLLEDFLTEADEQALENLRRDQENKRNLRMQRRQGISEAGEAGYRRERGVVIQVDSWP